eukprot:711096-Rhodomonas_salina.1
MAWYTRAVLTSVCCYTLAVLNPRVCCYTRAVLYRVPKPPPPQRPAALSQPRGLWPAHFSVVFGRFSLASLCAVALACLSSGTDRGYVLRHSSSTDGGYVLRHSSSTDGGYVLRQLTVAPTIAAYGSGTCTHASYWAQHAVAHTARAVAAYRSSIPKLRRL